MLAFSLKECGMDWEEIVNEYNQKMETLSKQEIKEEIEKYRNIISNIKKSEINEFFDNGTLPSALQKMIYQDNNDDTIFLSQKYNVELGSIYDLIDIEFNDNIEE